jgi:hypothetical protein
MNALKELCNAIYTAFTGDAPLVAAITGGLSRDRAPEGQAMPFMVYTVIASPADAVYGDDNRETYDIQFTLVGTGHDTQADNMDLFLDVFDDLAPTLATGDTFFQQRIEGPWSHQGPDPAAGEKSSDVADVWHWVVTYRYSVAVPQALPNSLSLIGPRRYVIGDDTVFSDDLGRNCLDAVPHNRFEFWDSRYWGGATDLTIDEDLIRESCATFEGNGLDLIVLDMEYSDGGWWFQDINEADPVGMVLIDTSIAAARRIIEIIREEYPAARIGFYGWFGGRYLQNIEGVGDFDQEQIAIDMAYMATLIDELDYLCPSLYAPYAADHARWCESSCRIIKHCTDTGKDVYPFIWHRLHSDQSLISLDWWKLMWYLCIGQAQGAVWFTTNTDTTVLSQTYIDFVLTL